MPTFSFCDQVISAPSCNPISGHERLRFIKNLQDAAAASDLFGQGRPDKPWLNGCPRIVYVEAGSSQVDDLLGQESLAIVAATGSRHWWLCDFPLLRTSLQASDSKLPANVASVLKMPDLIWWAAKGLSSPRKHLVIRASTTDLPTLIAFPNEWIIVDAGPHDEFGCLEAFAENLSGFGRDQTAAIFADRPWDFPSRLLADLDETAKRQEMRFREVPPWIRPGVSRL